MLEKKYSMVIVSKRVTRFFGWLLGGEPAGLALYPFIFLADKKYLNDKVIINHEKIHLRQQLEMGILPFYVWYLIAMYRVGYWNISFEKEAYQNQNDLTYLKKRSIFAFRKYLK